MTAAGPAVRRAGEDAHCSECTKDGIVFDGVKQEYDWFDVRCRSVFPVSMQSKRIKVVGEVQCLSYNFDLLTIRIHPRLHVD
jgi:hypothetical protein